MLSIGYHGLLHVIPVRGLTILKRPYPYNNQVSAAGVAELQKALLNCSIIHQPPPSSFCFAWASQNEGPDGVLHTLG